MQTVTVHRVDIAEDEVATAIAAALGEGVSASTDGPATVSVRKGFFARAKVTWRADGAATIFEVHGQGPPVPLGYVTLRVVNDRGLARRVGEAIKASVELGHAS